MTFLEQTKIWRQISDCQGLGEREGGMSKWGTWDFQGYETIVFDTVMVDTYHLHSHQNPYNVQHKLNPDVKYGLKLK